MQQKPVKGKLKGKSPKKDDKKPYSRCGCRVLTWHARRDSNPQLSEPESDALSIELRTQTNCITSNALCNYNTAS